MWPATPFFDRPAPRRDHEWEDEAPEGAITRPMFWLGSLFLGGASGQDPNAERAPLI